MKNKGILLDSVNGSHRGYENGLCLREGVRGAVWYYQFKVAGRVYEGSTRKGKDAKREAQAYLTQLKGKLLAESRKPKASAPPSMSTLSTVHDEWLEANKDAFDARHLSSVARVWDLHIKPALGSLPMDKIGTTAVETLRASYLPGHSSGGANFVLKVLSTLFGFAIGRGYIPARPYKVKKLTVQRKPRPVLPPESVGEFLAVADRSRNPHAPAMVRMMVGLGLRESEARTARWEWVSFSRKTYTPGLTKGREAVAIPMGDWLTDYLWGLPWRAPEGLMFPADDETETPHSIGYTRKVIERGAKAIGLIHVTPHRLRATFATLHADAGTPLRRIQSMTRHKSILTLMRYIEDSEAGLREAQEIVAGRMGLAAPPKPKVKTAKVGKTGREVSKK